MSILVAMRWLLVENDRKPVCLPVCVTQPHFLERVTDGDDEE